MATANRFIPRSVTARKVLQSSAPTGAPMPSFLSPSNSFTPVLLSTSGSASESVERATTGPSLPLRQSVVPQRSIFLTVADALVPAPASVLGGSGAAAPVATGSDVAAAAAAARVGNSKSITLTVRVGPSKSPDSDKTVPPSPSARVAASRAPDKAKIAPPSLSLKNGLKKNSTRMVPLGTAPAAILAAALYSPRDHSVQTSERNKKLFSSKGMNEPSKDDVAEDPDYKMSVDDIDSESDGSDEESNSEDEDTTLATAFRPAAAAALLVKTGNRDGEKKSNRSRSHSSNKYGCDRCIRWFKSRKSLYGHQKIHDGQGFTCPECLKLCVSPSKLKEHSTCHVIAAGERSFNCGHCAAKFRTPRGCEQHWLQQPTHKTAAAAAADAVPTTPAVVGFRPPSSLVADFQDSPIVTQSTVGSPSNKRKRDHVDEKHSAVSGANKKVSVDQSRLALSPRPFEGSAANTQDTKSAAAATTNEMGNKSRMEPKVDDLKAGGLVTEIAKSVVSKATAALELAQNEMKQAEFKKSEAQSRKEAATQREKDLKTAEEKAADAQKKALGLQIAAAKMKHELTVLQAATEAAVSLATEFEAKAKSIKQLNEKELIGDEELVLSRAEEGSKRAADQLSEAERTWRLINSFSPQDIALIRSKHNSLFG